VVVFHVGKKFLSYFRNAEALEARVRKELEEQGILDPNDEDGVGGEATKDNDEILEELQRCQVTNKCIRCPVSSAQILSP
jgi:hypothetical protein